MRWKIMLSDIDLGDEEINSVLNVLKSKWLSMGKVTKKFEEKFAEYLGVKYAFAVSSGTAALHIACRALNIGVGDEVILPALTFVATSNAVLYCGAKPVFADITSTQNFNISPDDILEKISSRSKAIIVVHYGGYPCDMKAILDIAEDYKLKVIEDSAHAIGAEYNGTKCGTIGDVGCFSFFANKNLVTGEGGMIVTDDRNLAEKISVLRSHGMTTLTWDRFKGHSYTYDVVDLGYNYRLTELASALGIVQLKKLDRNNKKREKLVSKYKKLLRNLPLEIPFKKFVGKSSYHIFPILLNEAVNRFEFMDYLSHRGIQTSIHYRPVHLFTYYRKTFGFKEGMLPKTEYVGSHEVTLPLHPLMCEEDIQYISDVISSFFNSSL